jgi:hypothetical protein
MEKYQGLESGVFWRNRLFSYVKILCLLSVILTLLRDIRKSPMGAFGAWLIAVCAVSSRKDRTSGGESSTQDRNRATSGPTWTAALWDATMDVYGSLYSHDGCWAIPLPDASSPTCNRPHIWPTPTNIWDSTIAPSTSGCTTHLSLYGASWYFHASRFASLYNVWDSTFWTGGALYAISPLSSCWEPSSCGKALCSIPICSSTST